MPWCAHIPDALTEGKHLGAEHDQSSHGNRVDRNTTRRVLLRGNRPSPPQRTPQARPVRGTPSVSGPATAEKLRAKKKTAAASPRPKVVRKPPAEPDRTTPPPAPDRPPLKDMDDDALARLYNDAITGGDDDLADDVMAELDRRDGDEAAWSEQEDAAFLDKLEGRPNRSEREQAKEAYQEYAQALWLRAVNDLGGAVLSRAASRDGISDLSLFNGVVTRPQMQKYASEELLEWFSKPGNDRLTETEFVNQWLGKESVADRGRRRSSLGGGF